MIQKNKYNELSDRFGHRELLKCKNGPFLKDHFTPTGKFIYEKKKNTKVLLCVSATITRNLLHYTKAGCNKPYTTQLPCRYSTTVIPLAVNLISFFGCVMALISACDFLASLA